jgi:vacuolar-type H+-ATPase subunit I/STV1
VRPLTAKNSCEEKLSILAEENKRIKEEMTKIISENKVFEQVKDLLAIIRRLEERVEALERENEKLRRELRKCKSETSLLTD